MTLLTAPKADRPSRGRNQTRRDAVPREADTSLIIGLLQREPGAAAALYDRYASRIFGLGLVLLGNKSDAEDLVQDTFLKVWRKGASFDPERGPLDAWILLNARSLAIDLLRRRTLEARSLSSGRWHSDVSDEPSPESYAEHSDMMRRARNAMDRLPHGQRSAVELTYLGQRSSTQVAELQGIPPGTVKSRIRRGIATLHQTLLGQDNP